MSHVDAFVRLVEDPAAPAIDPSHPANAALLAVLAAVAFSDGKVDGPELGFLARLLPGRAPEALRGWAQASGARPLDLAAVAAAIPSLDDRWKVLRFASRMAWKDGRVAREEQALLDTIAEGLGLPEGAVDRALGDALGRGATFLDGQRVIAAVKAMEWDSVDFTEEPLRGPLRDVVPDKWQSIGKVAIDGIECVGLYREGLVGRFREGSAAMRWGEIVSFSRGDNLGGSISIFDESGGTHTLGDFRLRGLGILLDRLFGGAQRPTSPPPRIELVQRPKPGEDD